MVVLQLSLRSFNIELHARLRHVSIRSIKYVLVNLQYDGSCSHSILKKINFCNCTLSVSVLDARGHRPVHPSPLHGTGDETYSVLLASTTIDLLFRKICNFLFKWA